MKRKRAWLRMAIPLLLFVLLPLFLLSFDSVRQFLTRAQGIPANIVVDTSLKLEPIKPSWNALSQGGEESTDMIAPVIDKVRALAPQYIRIDHLYDSYSVVSRDGGGQLTFDFSRLDEAVKSIRSTGAQPFFSLSYMPSVIAENGGVTDKPRDWNEWALVVQKTIEHYSGRTGLNLSDIYYEVWNEPDLFGGWKSYGDKNYLTLYSYAVRGAQNAQNVQPFKIGGPATTQLYKNWITALATFVTNNNLRLDFFSWHRYHTEPAQYAQDISDVTKWLFDYPNLVALPRIISEWGFDSDISRGYDGNLAAAHTIATVRQALYGYEQLFGFEVVDGKDPQGREYWGRWGLMTHPSFGAHLKPRYLAYQLLQKVEGTRLLLRGEGTWVTGIAIQKDETTRIILVNYDYYSGHSESVPLQITGLTDQTYVIDRNYLGRNVVHETQTVSGGAYLTNVIMPPNSIYLIELTPEKTPESL